MRPQSGFAVLYAAPPAPFFRGYTVSLLAPQQNQNRWPAFAASLALHLGLMLALPSLVGLSTPGREELAASRNERIMRTLRIRIPEQLYLAASGPAVERSRRPVVFKAQPRKPEPRQDAQQKPERARMPQVRASRRRLELPALPKRIITDQILLQPRSPAEMLPAAGLQLPELFFWAPPPPRQPIRPFVRPGHQNPPQARMRLDAPPRLEEPGTGVAAAPGFRVPGSGSTPYAPFVRPGESGTVQARMLGAPPQIEIDGLAVPTVAQLTPPRPGALTYAPLVRPSNPSSKRAGMEMTAPPGLGGGSQGVPASGVSAAGTPGAIAYAPPPAMPVRTTVSSNPQPAEPVVDTTAGDAVNLLALSTRSMPVREFVTVPPGNQAAETPGGDAGTALSGPGGNGRAGRPGQDAPKQAKAADGTGNGSSATHAAADAAAREADATMPWPSPPASSPKSNVHAGAASAGTVSHIADPLAESPAQTAAALKAAIEATRIVHPSNGVFDVVVQSAGLEGFPESAGVLSSKPVYSVYLQTGSKRDWILQYCVPTAQPQAPQVSNGVVRLVAPTRVNAPFPLTTFRPPSTQHTGKYLMLHGFITAHGRFEDMKVLGANDPAIVSATSMALERWEFRPATQDGQPLRVEVLLAIPPE